MNTSRTAIRNLLLVVLALISLRFVFGLSPIEEGLNRALEPVTSAVEDLAFSEDQNIDTNISNQAKVNQLEKANQDLRNQLSLTSDQVTADVIRKDVVDFRKQLIISKGSDQGIEKGQAVLFGDNLVGKIIRVTPTTATVQMINDPNFKTTAMTSNGAGGVVKTENGSLIFTLVPGNDLTDETVQTDGLDGQFTPGIPIGVLAQRITNEDSGFHSYHLIMPASFTAIDVVTVDRGSIP